MWEGELRLRLMNEVGLSRELIRAVQICDVCSDSNI